MPFHKRNFQWFRESQTQNHAPEQRIYTAFPDACTSIGIPENPLLWVLKQLDENKESEIDLQASGLSEIQTEVYGFVTADIQDDIYERIMWQCEGKIDLKEQVLLIREKRKERVEDGKKPTTG